MALDTQTSMSPAAVDELLGRHETGVLSLAEGDEPYAIPISYGYDPEDRRFYLRLVSTPESGKRQFLTATPRARIVVYEERPPTYRSVVASGPLVEVPTDELSVERIVQYGETRRPLFEIWAESERDLDVTLFELDPTALEGRMIEVDDGTRFDE